MSDNEIEPQASGPNGAEKPEAKPQNPEGARTTVASVLGEVCWLFSRAPSHRFFFMSDLEWLVIPCIVSQQFRIYRDESSRPVGLALWGRLNEEAEERLLQGSARIRPQDWTSGDRYWIVDLVDLSGGQRAQVMIDDLKSNVFKDTPFSYHKTDPQGNRTVMRSDQI